MVRKILQKESPVLREISQSVPLDQIQSPKIKKIISEMKIVAIAASQIGYPLRIFVVSKKVEGLVRKTKKDTPQKPEDSVFINPILKKVSKEREIVEEGCLSIRYLYGKVSRSNKAIVQAYDENGKKFERGGTGLLAQIFQHEMDHLDGILFIDKAKFVEEIPPVKNKE